MKNLFIDALDQIVSQPALENRWAAAEAFAAEQGIKSILVASLNTSTLDVRWVNTNMPNEWIEEYLYHNYIHVDPLAKFAVMESGTKLLKPGLLTKTASGSEREWRYNHGVRSAGYGAIICSRFAQPGNIGTSVTLGFEDLSEAETTKWLSDGRVLSALLAVNIQSPLDDENNGLLGQMLPRLTTRQKDVLCLLANGDQTGRIAEKLQISEATVSFHLACARKVLGARTREQALAIALKQNLISP